MDKDKVIIAMLACFVNQIRTRRCLSGTTAWAMIRSVLWEEDVFVWQSFSLFFFCDVNMPTDTKLQAEDEMDTDMIWWHRAKNECVYKIEIENKF